MHMHAVYMKSIFDHQYVCNRFERCTFRQVTIFMNGTVLPAVGGVQGADSSGGPDTRTPHPTIVHALTEATWLHTPHSTPTTVVHIPHTKAVTFLILMWLPLLIHL